MTGRFSPSVHQFCGCRAKDQSAPALLARSGTAGGLGSNPPITTTLESGPRSGIPSDSGDDESIPTEGISAFPGVGLKINPHRPCAPRPGTAGGLGSNPPITTRPRSPGLDRLRRRQPSRPAAGRAPTARPGPPACRIPSGENARIARYGAGFSDIATSAPMSIMLNSRACFKTGASCATLIRCNCDQLRAPVGIAPEQGRSVV